MQAAGNVVIAMQFSNKTIIFIHATDSALFTVFLTITHTLTKLKRLFTSDNLAVPFYGWPITGRFYEKDKDKSC